MGKASSAKKVARAARAGSSTKRERPKIGFPLAVFAIVVLGTSLVVFARTSREPASAAAPSYLNSDHWHAAYGVYVCDKFLPPLQDLPSKPDVNGIHTHGEGVMHIHPFSSAASGDRARLSVFAEQVGVTFTNDGFTAPDGTEYKNGYDCNGQPAQVQVIKWFPDDPTRPGEVYTDNFNNIVFDTDRAAYTIAVVPEGVVPPLPDSVPGLDNLVDAAPTGAGAPPGLDPNAIDPSLLDPSQLSIDPATGQPVVPTDSTVTPPVTDAAVTPTSAAESDPASPTP